MNNPSDIMDAAVAGPASSGDIDPPVATELPSPSGAHLILLDGAPLTAATLSRMVATLAAGGFNVVLTPTATATVAQAQAVNSAIDGACDGGRGEQETQAYARGEAALLHWTRDGTLIDGTELAGHWSLTRQGLDRARARGELFSLWIKGQHWYPAEALKFRRGDFAQINEALGASEPASKLLFLLRRHGGLHGEKAAAAVAAGRLNVVIDVAQAWATM